ncbi:TIM barrel protein [Nonomuraea sp. B19D2]|uniref:sugar phosphate isomerase/epimerase family protein n=1 Tax=Nonomuraea sp. B19D2 TaxID=3159561 RepID=UPI0032DAD9F6
MTAEPLFGAGLWHFGQFRDRYATDGYGPPVSTLEAIDRAGQVGSLSVVDINYPFNPGDLDVELLEERLKANGLRAIALTPEIYTRKFARGGFTNPDPGIRREAIELVSESADLARRLGCDYVKLWPGQDGWDYRSSTLSRSETRAAARSERSWAHWSPTYNPGQRRTSRVRSDPERQVPFATWPCRHSQKQPGRPRTITPVKRGPRKPTPHQPSRSLRSVSDPCQYVNTGAYSSELMHTGIPSSPNSSQPLPGRFPFREDAVEAARAGIEVMRTIWRALQILDVDALAEAQARQDALAAQRIARKALLTAQVDG